MNKLNVGDYVKLDNGIIRKIIKIDKLIWLDKDFIEGPEYHNSVTKDMIIKSSPNIIDLIEVGDYVNGYKVIDIVKGFKVIIDKLEVDTTTGLYHNIGITNIESVVTKEQFENISYKVGE